MVAISRTGMARQQFAVSWPTAEGSGIPILSFAAVTAESAERIVLNEETAFVRFHRQLDRRAEFRIEGILVDSSTLISFAGGLGLGSAATAFVKHWLQRRGKHADILLEQKRQAFDGFLVAYADLAKGWSDEKAKQFALCEARIQLIGSTRVIQSIALLKSSEPDSESRARAHNQLILSIREDLGLSGEVA